MNKIYYPFDKDKYPHFNPDHQYGDDPFTVTDYLTEADLIWLKVELEEMYRKVIPPLYRHRVKIGFYTLRPTSSDSLAQRSIGYWKYTPWIKL